MIIYIESKIIYIRGYIYLGLGITEEKSKDGVLDGTMEILGNRRKLDIYSTLGCRKTWLPLSDPTFQRLR